MEPVGKCSHCGKSRVLLCIECSEVHPIASQKFDGLRLCVECDRTFEAPATTCPCCLSTSFVMAQNFFSTSKITEARHLYCCPTCEVVFRLETSQCCPSCSGKELVRVSDLIERDRTGEHNDSEKSLGEVSPFRSRIQVAGKGRSYREIG